MKGSYRFFELRFELRTMRFCLMNYIIHHRAKKSTRRLLDENWLLHFKSSNLTSVSMRAIHKTDLISYSKTLSVLNDWLPLSIKILKVLLSFFLRIHSIQYWLPFGSISSPKLFDLFLHFEVKIGHSRFQFIQSKIS